jgi:hypothetical protein
MATKTKPKPSRFVGFRLKPEDFADIEELAKTAQRKVADWLRLAVLEIRDRDKGGKRKA